MNWNEAKKIIKQDPEVEKELEKNAVEYALIQEVLKIRKENNLTQAELAALINTSQSNISRLESGSYNPTVKFLKKIADKTGKKLEIKFI